MADGKSLMDKTTEAVTSAAQTVTDGLKNAGQAVVEAITPKPIKAGDKVIIPSVDPSMPPIVVPAKKRARRSTTGRKTKAAKHTAARKTTARKMAARKTAVRRRAKPRVAEA